MKKILCDKWKAKESVERIENKERKANRKKKHFIVMNKKPGPQTKYSCVKCGCHRQRIQS